MNVFGPFHMQTRSREDSAKRNFFLEGEFSELFLYCLGLNFTHLSRFVFYFKNFIIFRSAGDVLQDIGSMLSDLTDELDAMLKLEKDND